MSVRALRRGAIAAGRVQAPSTVNVLQLPGTSGNYVSTPDTVANSITSDIDMRARVAVTDWTVANQYFLAKLNGAGARSFRFSTSAGGLRWAGSEDGTTAGTVDSTVGHSFVNGSEHWVRATWRNSDQRVQFFTSADGSSWTQLGSDINYSVAVGFPLASLFDSTAPVTIGGSADGTFHLLTGNVYYAELRNGIGGTVVQSFDATAVTKIGTRNPATVSAGGPWTINGSAWDWATV